MILAVAMVLVAAYTLVIYQSGSAHSENDTSKSIVKLHEAMTNDELLAYTQKYGGGDHHKTR